MANEEKHGFRKGELFFLAANITHKIVAIVPTYIADKGHTNPQISVEMEVHQGITLKLPKEEVTGQTARHLPPADIYIERIDGAWTINISPEEDEIKVVVTVHDTGLHTVRDET